jgi:protein-ribulosamine 3-kinase
MLSRVMNCIFHTLRYPTMAGLHPIFVIHLERLEPGETFVSHGVRIQSSSGRQYYFKTGSSCDYEQWAGEATSLVAMRDAAPGIAPQLYAFGLTHKSGEELDPDSVTSSEGVPYFLSAYSDHGSLSEPAAIALGKRLGSEMHRYQSPNGKFGFEIPTYCGATRFSNGWYDSWAECYSAMIGEMLGYLKQRGKFQSLQKKGEELRQRYVLHFTIACHYADSEDGRVIPHLLESLNVQPVLLHGDLWARKVKKGFK